MVMIFALISREYLVQEEVLPFTCATGMTARDVGKRDRDTKTHHRRRTGSDLCIILLDLLLEKMRCSISSRST
tara:strand:- start:158 stop:376 length:219 start_codon:yes stop_codon:yes gene_type:complete